MWFGGGEGRKRRLRRSIKSARPTLHFAYDDVFGLEMIHETCRLSGQEHLASGGNRTNKTGQQGFRLGVKPEFGLIHDNHIRKIIGGLQEQVVNVLESWFEITRVVFHWALFNGGPDAFGRRSLFHLAQGCLQLAAALPLDDRKWSLPRISGCPRRREPMRSDNGLPLFPRKFRK